MLFVWSALFIVWLTQNITQFFERTLHATIKSQWWEARSLERLTRGSSGAVEGSRLLEGVRWNMYHQVFSFCVIMCRFSLHFVHCGTWFLQLNWSHRTSNSLLSSHLHTSTLVHHWSMFIRRELCFEAYNKRGGRWKCSLPLSFLFAFLSFPWLSMIYLTIPLFPVYIIFNTVGWGLWIFHKEPIRTPTKRVIISDLGDT